MLQVRVKKDNDQIGPHTALQCRILDEHDVDITEMLACTKIEIVIEGGQAVKGVFHCLLGHVDIGMLAQIAGVQDEGELLVGGDLWRRDRLPDAGNYDDTTGDRS